MMAVKIEIDDTEPPIIDVLVKPLPWKEIESHVRVSQRFLLAEIPDSGQYRGVYRAGSGIATTGDLGTDREAAVKQFREYLRQPAE
jgi:hypothetical protein